MTDPCSPANTAASTAKPWALGYDGEMEESKPGRRWLRFSLLTLLVLITAFCCWVGYQRDWIRQQLTSDPGPPYMIITVDGKVVLGNVKKRTNQSVVVETAPGVETKIPLSQIEEMTQKAP